MYVTVPDYRIEAVNRARPGAENKESSIIYAMIMESFTRSISSSVWRITARSGALIPRA